MKHLTIRLPERLCRQLDMLVKIWKKDYPECTRSSVIRSAVAKFLQKGGKYGSSS